MTETPRADLSARIERLPFGKFHWHLLLMGGFGYTFDGLDLAIVSFVLPVLRPLCPCRAFKSAFSAAAPMWGT